MHIAFFPYWPKWCTTYDLGSLLWVRGRAIGKGIDFPDIGIKNGINFYNFGMRNGTDFQGFGMKYKEGYTFSKNWYKERVCF